jgi:PII-like signaling protein
VTQDCLTLTTYFGERDRAADAFLADALLDAYARANIHQCILLRGAQGFGLKHHLRTDSLLTLSEDLPVVAIAVDARERIDGVLGPVRELMRKGLLTLERSRMLDGGAEPARLPEGHADATKLTVYLGRRQRIGRRPAFVTVCEVLRRHGVAGATVLLGVDGTNRGRRARARFFGRNTEVPVMVVAVGTGERIAAASGELGELLRDPLFTLERVHLCKRDGELLDRPPLVPGTDRHGLPLWQKLTVYASETARREGSAMHIELLRRLRGDGGRGATTVRGIWGFHGEHAPHGDRVLQVRRRVPVVTTIIEPPDRIDATFAVIDELTTERGLVTSEMVPALSAVVDGRADGDLVLGGEA